MKRSIYLLHKYMRTAVQVTDFVKCLSSVSPCQQNCVAKLSHIDLSCHRTVVRGMSPALHPASPPVKNSLRSAHGSGKHLLHAAPSLVKFPSVTAPAVDLALNLNNSDAQQQPTTIKSLVGLDSTWNQFWFRVCANGSSCSVMTSSN